MYQLCYPDGSDVVTLPGSEEVFTLEKYKEDLGKSYQRIALFLCPSLQSATSESDPRGSESDFHQNEPPQASGSSVSEVEDLPDWFDIPDDIPDCVYVQDDVHQYAVSNATVSLSTTLTCATGQSSCSLTSSADDGVQYVNSG